MCNASVFKKLRSEKRLSQQQVADFLHMDRSTYAYYEVGQTKPTIDFLAGLAQLYGMRLCDLLHDDMPVEKPRSRSGMKISQLERDEQTLVVLYRAGSAAQRDALLARAKELAH